LSTAHRPPWRLPPGVSRGVWQYAQTEHVADQYDEYFAENRLFRFDEQVLARHFDRPGLVVDLGCGTGRTLIPLARRGFRALAVDLSPSMLRIVGRKAAEENLPIARLQANLVQLDCLRDESADYCTCLFSTLGMIRGRENRRRVLGHARRILKPSGLFVLHAHNLWFGLFDSVSRRWLAGQLWCSLLGRGTELGDKFFDYRGIPKMFLHTFTQRELVGDLRSAGFRLEELIPLAVTRQRPLPHAWFFGSLRANGWIAVCERPPRSGNAC
jgi:ubiquinone/menaquinone biosynthesis C-methylase UbiE